MATLSALSLFAVACGAPEEEDEDATSGDHAVRAADHAAGRCGGSLRCDDLKAHDKGVCLGLNAHLAGQSCDANCGLWSCDLEGYYAVGACRAARAIDDGVRTSDACREKLFGDPPAIYLCRSMLIALQKNDCSDERGRWSVGCEIVHDRMPKATQACILR